MISTSTPDGLLHLDYNGLFAPIVKAIQEISSISHTFRTNLIAWLGDATNGIDKIFANEIVATNVNASIANVATLNASTTNTEKLCLGSRCMTAEQFNHILDMEAAAGTPTSGVASGGTGSSPTGATSGPPTITISGANPAHLNVGDSYADFGATITGPQADLNLGIHTFVDGVATDPVVIDTTAPALI